MDDIYLPELNRLKESLAMHRNNYKRGDCLRRRVMNIPGLTAIEDFRNLVSVMCQAIEYGAKVDGRIDCEFYILHHVGDRLFSIGAYVKWHEPNDPHYGLQVDCLSSNIPKFRTCVE